MGDARGERHVSSHRDVLWKALDELGLALHLHADVFSFAFSQMCFSSLIDAFERRDMSFQRLL